MLSNLFGQRLLTDSSKLTGRKIRFGNFAWTKQEKTRTLGESPLLISLPFVLRTAQQAIQTTAMPKWAAHPYGRS